MRQIQDMEVLSRKLIDDMRITNESARKLVNYLLGFEIATPTFSSWAKLVKSDADLSDRKKRSFNFEQIARLIELTQIKKKLIEINRHKAVKISLDKVKKRINIAISEEYYLETLQESGAVDFTKEGRYLPWYSAHTFGIDFSTGFFYNHAKNDRPFRLGLMTTDEMNKWKMFLHEYCEEHHNFKKVS